MFRQLRLPLRLGLLLHYGVCKIYHVLFRSPFCFFFIVLLLFFFFFFCFLRERSVFSRSVFFVGEILFFFARRLDGKVA